jgi:hypothetical protein
LGVVTETLVRVVIDEKRDKGRVDVQVDVIPVRVNSMGDGGIWVVGVGGANNSFSPSTGVAYIYQRRGKE